MPDVGEFFSEAFPMLSAGSLAPVAYVVAPKRLVPLVVLMRDGRLRGAPRVYLATLDAARVVAVGEVDMTDYSTPYGAATFIRWHAPSGVVRPSMDMRKGLGTALYLGGALAAEGYISERRALGNSPLAGTYSRADERTDAADDVWQRLSRKGLALTYYEEEEADEDEDEYEDVDDLEVYEFNYLPAERVRGSGLTLFPAGFDADFVHAWSPPPPRVMGALEWSGTPAELASTLVLLNAEQSDNPMGYFEEVVAALRASGERRVADAVLAREGELEGARQLPVANPPPDYARDATAWVARYGAESSWV